jgi:hypothetical protein
MPRRLPTRVRDRRGRLVHCVPPGAPQPEAQVHVLDIHEIPFIEPPHALPRAPRQQHAGPRHPIHDGRPVARSVIGVVPTGGRIGWPHGTEKPVDRSRHDAGKGSSARILGAVLVECPWSHTAHRRVFLSLLEKSAQCAGRQLCVRIKDQHHGADPCCNPWFTAAAKPRFESFTMTAEPRCRAVPTLSSDERLSTTTTRTAMPSWLLSESMQVEKIRSTVVGHHDAVNLGQNGHGWRA